MKGFIERFDALALYSRLFTLEFFRRATLSGPENFGGDAAIEFFGGLVLAASPDDVEKNIDLSMPPEVPFVVHQLLRQVLNDELAMHMVSGLKKGKADAPELVKRMVRMENLTDRMRGFVPHAEKIFARITRPLDEHSRAHLGFPLSSAWSASEAYVERHRDQFERLQPRSVRPDRSSPGADREVFDEFAGLVAAGAASLETDFAGIIAGQLPDLQPGEVKPLVSSLSASLGSNNNFDSPWDYSVLRTRPVIVTSDGRHLWPNPIDFADIALDWAHHACSKHSKMLQLFDKKRQDTSEDLVFETLGDLFGFDRIFKQLVYDVPGKPDVDVLVELPGGVGLVCEVKGGRLTQSGRRGTELRVEKKLEEFVVKAAFQNDRTIEAVGQKVGFFDKKRRRHDVSGLTEFLSIIVVLERVDPFYWYSSRSGSASDPRNQPWVVNLSDLLMVAEVLSDPSAFLAYVATRVEMNLVGGPLVIEEAAALELWCDQRIEPTSAESGVSVIQQSAEKLNNHYTFVTNGGDGIRPALPDPCVPEAVRSLIAQKYLHRASDWAALTRAIYRVDPSTWKSVARTIEIARVDERALSRPNRKKIRSLERGLRLSRELTLSLARPAADSDPPFRLDLSLS